MLTLNQQYLKKRISASEAASKVSSENSVVYGQFTLFPETLDKALSLRKDSLSNVKIKTMCSVCLPEVVKVDPEREHFIWTESHYSGISRTAHNSEIVNYSAGTYHQLGKANELYNSFDIAFLKTSPMNKHGYFSFGINNSDTLSILKKSKCIILEINENVPFTYGGRNEYIHISEIDYIVESENLPLPTTNNKSTSENDKIIAELIVKEIENGSCIQLGIGSLPNAIGTLIANSDLKNLGVHTEMLADSYLEMYKAGKINGRRKNIDYGKFVYTFAFGSNELYDFIDQNPSCLSCSADYTNNPYTIAANEKVISINSALSVDLFSQVSSESVGPNQISGTGGQLDFVMGAFNSKGGKSFICLNSTFKDKKGNLHSNIKPIFEPGTNVTVPRSLVNYVVTEYGMVQLKGKDTWQRAEALISIAHPNFREELTKQANDLKIWSHR